MDNETLLHLITASVSPAVMISGSALLILGFLGRQGLLTGRLRELHDKALHHAERFAESECKNCYHSERAALSMQQAKAVYARTRNVKWTLIFLFIDIIAFVMTSICLGVSVASKEFLAVAVAFFIVGMLALLVAMLFGMSGALKSLTPLYHEEQETEKLLAKMGK